MSWSSEIAQLRDALKGHIAQKLGELVGWTYTAHSSALGDADAVELADGKTPSQQRPVRRIEPWGHRGRPPGKQRALTIRLGSSNVFFIGIGSNGGYGPGDLAEGETALYCSQSGTTVKLDKDGNVMITAAAGKDVTVNGGGAKVSRVGDHTSGHTHNPGGFMCPNTGTGTPVAITGVSASATDSMAEGAPNFKG